MSTVTEKNVAPPHVKMSVQTTPQKPKKAEKAKLPELPAPKKLEGAKKPKLPAPPAPKAVPPSVNTTVLPKPPAVKKAAPPAPKVEKSTLLVPPAPKKELTKEEVGNKLHKLQTERKEAEKPEAKEEKKPKIVTGVVHHEMSRGKGTGKGTKFRAKMFGYWGTSVIRWMWKDGFEFVEVKAAVTALLGEQTYQDSTLRAQRGMFKSGSKTEVADLTDEQAEQLRKFKIKK